MIRKFYVFLLCVLLLPFFVFSQENIALTDTSTDSVAENNAGSGSVVENVNNLSESKIPFPIRFRGSVSAVFSYLFDCQDGVNHPGHFAPICYDKNDYREAGKHHGEDGAGRIVGGNYGGVQMELYNEYGFSVPVLNFDTPLTKDNFLQFKILSQLSPVTLNVGGTMTLAAAAFLQFQFGFFIGGAWEVPAFNVTGTGIKADNEGNFVAMSFDAPILQLWFKPTFQFDLAYVLPPAYQKWTHFFILANPQFQYQHYFGVDYDQPYIYKADYGMQFNGWKLTGDFTTGYRIFIREDNSGTQDRFLKITNYTIILTFAFYLHIDHLNLSHYEDSKMENGGWGSDFASINFGPALRLDLPYHIWAQFFFLFRNDRAYTDDTFAYADFRKRTYEDYYVFAKSVGFFIGWDF